MDEIFTMSIVLVVDDSEINRLLATMTLTAQGHQADEACNGSEALAMLERRRYDCVLLDISMPEMSGYEVCARIRRDPRLASTRVVAYTAHALGADRRKMLDTGFDAVLTKPASLQAFEQLFTAPALR